MGIGISHIASANSKSKASVDCSQIRHIHLRVYDVFDSVIRDVKSVLCNRLLDISRETRSFVQHLDADVSWLQ